MMRSALRVALLSTAVASVACGTDPDGIDPGWGPEEDAEIGSVQQAIGTTHGTRPLLVILMQRDATTPLARSANWYTTRIFGPGFPNVRDYFKAISKNRFTFSQAQVVSVVDRTDAKFLKRAGITSTTGSTDSTRLRSLMLADDAGFPFENYDTNDDGEMTEGELAVLTIDNYTPNSGQTGSPPCVMHPGNINVCTQVSLAGHQSELLIYAHELSHQLGTIDLYGAGSNSTRETLMGAQLAPLEANQLYHLDPWHREKLGWTVSGVIGSSAGGSVKLQPVSTLSSPFGNAGFERLRLNRTNASTNESLFIEYRKRDATYDRDVAAQGIVFWYFQLNSFGNPAVIPALANPAQTDRAHFVLGPNSACVGDPNDATSRGRTTATAATASYRFKWLDGTDTGWHFTIGNPAANGTITVAWTQSTAAPSCP